MADKAGDMLDIARDILLTARLDDKERFKQVCACMHVYGVDAGVGTWGPGCCVVCRAGVNMTRVLQSLQ